MARELAGAGMASVLSKMLRITTEALRVLEPRCPIQAGSLSPAFSESQFKRARQDSNLQPLVPKSAGDGSLKSPKTLGFLDCNSLS